jgi:hypothetical protein
MIRRSLQFGMATALVLVGWMAAKAQTSAPDFEIVVNAPRQLFVEPLTFESEWPEEPFRRRKS